MIKELVPDATKAGILYCSSEANSKVQADVAEAELKKLVKAKEAALKAEAEKKAAEDKEKLMKAFSDSEKTVEEVLDFLKKK